MAEKIKEKYEESHLIQIAPLNGACDGAGCTG